MSETMPEAAAAGQPATLEDLQALRADLAALREENDRLRAPMPVKAPQAMSPPTHNVLLADGTVVDGSTIGTHHVREDGLPVPVVAVYPKESAA